MNGVNVATLNVHEYPVSLSTEVQGQHRAMMLLIEELRAADWYAQRVDAAMNDADRALLEKNRDEELEYAAMAIEWLRRRSPALDRHLRKYLFTRLPLPDPV